MGLKYLLVLQNERSYIQYEDDSDKRLIQDSFLTWHAITNGLRADFPRMVHIDEVKYNDFPYGIDVGQDL